MYKLFFFLLTLTSNSFAQEPQTFTLINHLSKNVTLDFSDEHIYVLEWFNKDCPFVKKFYESNNMQELQKKWSLNKVKWYTIISSAQGKQGYETIEEITITRKFWNIQSQATLHDPSGRVGQMYGAKTTPHMYIIKDKKIIYRGAIDSIPSTDPADIQKAVNYVDLALTSLKDNKKIKTSRTKPYGCSVKY